MGWEVVLRNLCVQIDLLIYSLAVKKKKPSTQQLKGRKSLCQLTASEIWVSCDRKGLEGLSDSPPEARKQEECLQA